MTNWFLMMLERHRASAPARGLSGAALSVLSR
jgi:hypothetical protein